MNPTDERRDNRAERVPLKALVELCGNDPGVPAFEAESLDVSGRGMHCRTAYVPQLGDSLVCRLEHEGREIVVEGEVAWARPDGEGGEFGMKFTALDSGSVETLRALCGISDESAQSEAEAKAPAHEAVAESNMGLGSRVRLHIEGLGAPMKARVREGSDRRVQVGSNLEFLRVGRQLELEDLEHGRRVQAHIDSVTVKIDPETQVPELVVALKFDHGDTTPEPSVIDSMDATEMSPEPSDEDLVEAGSATLDQDPTEEELDQEASDAESALMRGRLANAAVGFENATKRAGATAIRLGGVAGARLGGLLRDVAVRVRDARAARQGQGSPRRTAPPPAGPLSAGGRLRPQRGPVAAEVVQPIVGKRARTRVMVAAGALVLTGGLAGVWALSGPSSAPVAETTLPKAEPVAVAPAAAAQPGAAPVAPLGAPTRPGEVSANVPLFGPTPLATMEPAPLEPPPEEAASDEEAREKAAAAASVEDESFPEAPKAQKRPVVSAPSKAAPRPEDVKAWGRGNMHLPTVHRLRLDGPGAAIQGALNPTGFTVVIPSRKVMESGKAILKRDTRIAQVKTTNIGAGAQISFRFREQVPAYRVRLRRDFVEILVSAPEAKAPEPSAKKPAKATH